FRMERSHFFRHRRYGRCRYFYSKWRSNRKSRSCSYACICHCGHPRNFTWFMLCGIGIKIPPSWWSLRICKSYDGIICRNINWMVVLGAWLAASSFVSQGFGNYLHSLTGAPPLASAISLLLVLGILNILGFKFSGIVQFGIVIIVIIVFILFFLFDFSHVYYSLYTPFAPNGFEGILAAAL